MIKSFIICLSIAFLSATYPAVISKKNINYNEKKECADIISRLEQKYNIPHNLLHAIAHVESKIHPWAVNANGKSRFFKTKEKAVNYAQNLRHQKVRNIGVGCMQINLSAHGKKFKSIADAFDPAFNIEYSAKLLKSLYNRFGDWKKAVEYYHTANPRFHIPYGNRVYRIWYKMQDTSPEFFSRSENKKHFKFGFGPGMGIGSRLD